MKITNAFIFGLSVLLFTTAAYAEEFSREGFDVQYIPVGTKFKFDADYFVPASGGTAFEGTGSSEGQGITKLYCYWTPKPRATPPKISAGRELEISAVTVSEKNNHRSIKFNLKGYSDTIGCNLPAQNGELTYYRISELREALKGLVSIELAPIPELAPDDEGQNARMISQSNVPAKVEANSAASQAQAPAAAAVAESAAN